MSVLATEWLDHVRPIPQVSARLFCLPHAGGDALQYMHWQPYFLPSIQVCPIQLPGRGRRMAQRPLRSARSIAEAAHANLGALLHEPFALFGHSMGALIAYELGCVLEDRGIVPEVLIVAAKSAPHLPARRARGLLPDDELIRELSVLDGTPREILADRSSLQFYLPLIRSDFAVVDTYVYDRKSRLTCPIVCFGGCGDPTTTIECLAAWSVHTAGAFELVMFPGNHFFVRQETAAVCRAIVTRLRR